MINRKGYREAGCYRGGEEKKKKKKIETQENILTKISACLCVKCEFLSQSHFLCISLSLSGGLDFAPII